MRHDRRYLRFARRLGGALVVSWVGCFWPVTQAAESARPGKPNLLVIMADDLGYADLGVQGGREIRTPSLDALAAAGVRCTNAYVSAPYCSPSRAGFLTGRYQTRFGHEFNPHQGDEARLGLPLDQKTIADHLRAAGYATGLIGKWHQGFSAAHHPQSRGFDEFFGFLVGAHNFILRRDATPKFGSAQSLNMLYRGRELQKLDGYTTDVFADEALAFIGRHASEPWFLFLSFNAVHTPLEIAERLAPRIPKTVTDPARRGYLSLLLGLDDAVGRITQRLRETGRDQDTLIVFLADNGGSGRKPFFAYNAANNAPLRGDKGQTLEGGIRVPLFVAWPGKLPAGRTYDAPVIALDLLPTLCAAAGAAAPREIDGVNLLPHLRGDMRTPPHASLYWRFGPQRAVRRGQWKLVRWRTLETKTDTEWQLYNLTTDIGETKDLAAQHPQLVAELTRDWETWNTKNVPPLWHGTPNEDPTAPPRPARKKK